MIRDTIKLEEVYWEVRYRSEIDLIQSFNVKLQKGEIIPNRINLIKQSVVQCYIHLMKCIYSMGGDPKQLVPFWETACNLAHESWGPEMRCNVGKIPKFYNFYNLETYDLILWLLSLGILLERADAHFNLLIDIIDRHCVKDHLFEFLIRHINKNRPIIENESYEVYFKVPQTFEKLRAAIEASDKKEQEQKVEKFVKTDWHNKHKSCGWVDTHKSVFNIYSGYWCFEAAAVTKILDLDDSKYRDHKYYPKDLV